MKRRWIASVLSVIRERAGGFRPVLRLRTMAERVGRSGEDAAAEFLAEAGYELLCRNWRAPRNLGELDIVCRDDDGTLCIVEVKTRRLRARELPEPRPILAVDEDKRRRLRKAFAAYLNAIGKPDIPFRYDVIEVWADRTTGRPVRLRHWTDLFSGRPRYFLRQTQSFPELKSGHTLAGNS